MITKSVLDTLLACGGEAFDSHADGKPPGQMPLVQPSEIFSNIEERILNLLSGIAKLLSIHHRGGGHQSQVMLKLMMIESHSRRAKRPDNISLANSKKKLPRL